MKFTNLKGKKLLILAGADVHIKVVRAAKELGVYTIVTDYLNPEDSPAKQEADEYWMLNITDIDEIVSRCRSENVDGVLSFCIDPAQKPYQEICDKLNVPCYGTKSQFEIMTNKKLFKEFCRRHGVDVIPEYSLDDVENGKIEYPVLVKPSDSRGSRGQSIVQGKEEINDAIAKARAESHDGNVLIERYMAGAQDMSFAYIVINKVPYLLKIGDRFLGARQDNLQNQHIATVLPSLNSEVYKTQIEPKVVSMINSLGISYGAVFLQGFFEKGKVYMYDPGLRFPGGDFDLVLKKATGFDSMKSMVRFALTGDVFSCYGNPKSAYKLNGHICLILSVAIRAGKISSISGIDDIRRNPNIESISRRVNIGDVIPASGDIKQRAFEFVAYLPDRLSVNGFVDWIYDHLSIKDEYGNDMVVSKFNYKY